MASLSSFRKAELRRFFKLALALTAGLGQGALALTAVPVAAQDAPEDVGTAAEPPEEALPAPEAAPEPEPEPAPEPAPVPLSLDALIPVDAVDDPDLWAAAGVANPAATSDEAGFALDASSPVLDPALTGLAPSSESALMADIDAVFADLTLDAPTPLESDPELEALASIAAPVLAELPELTETQVDSRLVLALPAAEDAFPERREFLQRFKELSNLRQIGDDPESVPQVATWCASYRVAAVRAKTAMPMPITSPHSPASGSMSCPAPATNSAALTSARCLLCRSLTPAG